MTLRHSRALNRSGWLNLAVAERPSISAAHRFESFQPLRPTQIIIRELQPFGCHFAVDRTGFLILRRANHHQTMLGVPHVFFVLAAHGNCHD
jgi:hypothetical protein